MNDFNAIRAFYREMDVLIEATPKSDWAADPYAWSEVIQLTPIEAWLWTDIRQADVILYPQYPVGRFFVDFANPMARVAIECDGAAYHMDVEKDLARQREIEGAGWMVYRITGRDCRTEFDDETRKQSRARQFIDEIARAHGIKRLPSSDAAPNHWYGRLIRRRELALRHEVDSVKVREAEAIAAGDMKQLRQCQASRRGLEKLLMEIQA